MKHKAKPTGSGRGSRLGLAILAATVAAFLLVPVAQASAAAPTVEVNITGSGSGAVTSEFAAPPIECSYASPGPATGNCASSMEELEPEFFAVVLTRTPSEGSKFTGVWSLEGGSPIGGCANSGSTQCIVAAEEGEEVKVTVTFESEGPIGPVLTVTKEGTGSGTVVSSPAGIECGGTCSKDYLENTLVTLTASPGLNSSFTSWKGCETVEGRVCKVTMSAAKTVKAKFSPTYDVTVKKTTGATGLGSISGVTCDANCTAATASYLVGKTVTLAPKASKGSEFTEWSSCPGEIVETNKCKMSAAGTAEAKFTATPQFKLTVKKSGGGQGSVKSSPASINCGLTCSTQTSLFYKEASVVLTATVTAGKGSSLGNWSGGGCSGTEATPCTVSMTAAKEVTAEFK